jgi:glycosyltransferase involved in cell wall biosynthesis
MAAGLPCVGSAGGANLDVVLPGQTGYLATDDRDWERALHTLLTDLHTARAMGLAGRQRVRERFDTRVVSERAADLVEELAAGHRA